MAAAMRALGFLGLVLLSLPLPLLAACHSKSGEPSPAESASAAPSGSSGKRSRLRLSASADGAAPAVASDAASDGASPEAGAPPPYAMDRDELNRGAVRLNKGLYWVADKNKNGLVDPDEVVTLLFYPPSPPWVKDGRFTPDFDATLAAIRGLSTPPANEKLSQDEQQRRLIVGSELDQGVATLVYNDFRQAPEADKSFVQHMLAVAGKIDDLYGTMTGAKALEPKLAADDPASQSLFRRNWGPRCRAPLTEQNPTCSAIQGVPPEPVDIYPAALQLDPNFCATLEKQPNAKALTDHFSVVRDAPGGGGKLVAVPYNEAYKDQMAAVAEELKGASAVLGDDEASLKAYLDAAAASFVSNDWGPADEAWSKMTAKSSKWYVRAAPDEVYWEPCNHKAGFHLTFAKINAASVAWQEKLAPVLGDMEGALAALIGPPYAARKVSFHLPDFIDIVANAGDDRSPIGATIGESLPNWGKVVAQGRGRTVAMSNLYTDPDSLAIRRKQAESLLAADTVKSYADSPEPGLLATILHEATHNLGPAHEYKVKGKTDEQIFGGGLATMLEELKAQTGALYYVEYLRKKGLVSDELARQTYVDSLVWAFGHVSKGMYDADRVGKPYGQLAAIQLGFLIDEGAILVDATMHPANGRDKGTLVVAFDKLPDAIEKMMKVVGTIKAKGDKAGAEALVKKYVDAQVPLQNMITERELRFPKASFVYAVDR
jgi:hypothetical protein